MRAFCAPPPVFLHLPGIGTTLHPRYGQAAAWPALSIEVGVSRNLVWGASWVNACICATQQQHEPRRFRLLLCVCVCCVCDPFGTSLRTRSLSIWPAHALSGLPCNYSPGLEQETAEQESRSANSLRFALLILLPRARWGRKNMCDLSIFQAAEISQLAAAEHVSCSGGFILTGMDTKVQQV